MPRDSRNDEPGAWHHVTSRGLARRTLFESDRDIRKLLSLFARSVRAGRVEVHAYCVVTTHFHFLLRSPGGELSAVMQWVLNQYVRWFNRGRRRDGPLMRSRFVSKRADSLTYRRHLVRYIDFNPVKTGLAAAPALYPHGSARHYARAGGPRWLARAWIDGEIGENAAGTGERAARYADRFGAELRPALLRWVEQRVESPANDPDPLDELLAAAPDRVLAWMVRKTELADGTRVGLPLCTADAVGDAISERRARTGEWRIELDRGTACAWATLRVGLLRDMCAATLGEIAASTAQSTNGVWRSSLRHRELLEADPSYATAAAELGCAALRRCHGASSQRGRAGGR